MKCSSYRKIEEYFFKSKLTSLFDLAEAKINLSGLTKIAFELILFKYFDIFLKLFTFSNE